MNYAEYIIKYPQLRGILSSNAVPHIGREIFVRTPKEPSVPSQKQHKKLSAHYSC